MTNKQAKANVEPVRQRTQYSCMAASMAMCLRALDHDVTEDEVNRVMGARPMKGAAWEQALATAQHYGCRATLTMPATVEQLKAWTDAGVPVMIAWNPEGRDWSHASVVFDVDDDLNVYVADPNLPNPKKTVRTVTEDDFYGKWYEKFPDYLVRRPACAIEREVTTEGKQVNILAVEEAQPVAVKLLASKTASQRAAASMTPGETVMFKHYLIFKTGDIKPRTEAKVVKVGQTFTMYGPKEEVTAYTVELADGRVIPNVPEHYFDYTTPKLRDPLETAFKRVMKALKPLSLKRVNSPVRGGRSLEVPYGKGPVSGADVKRLIQSVPGIKGSGWKYTVPVRTTQTGFMLYNLTLNVWDEAFHDLTLYQGAGKLAAQRDTPTQAAIWHAWDTIQGVEKVREGDSFESVAQSFFLSASIEEGLYGTKYARLADAMYRKLPGIEKQTRSWRAGYNLWREGRGIDRDRLAGDMGKTLASVGQVQKALTGMVGIKREFPAVWVEVSSEHGAAVRATDLTVSALNSAIAMLKAGKVAGAEVMAGKKERNRSKDRAMSQKLKGQQPKGPKPERNPAAQARAQAEWKARKEDGRAGLPGAGAAGKHRNKQDFARGKKRQPKHRGVQAVDNVAQAFLKMAFQRTAAKADWATWKRVTPGGMEEGPVQSALGELLQLTGRELLISTNPDDALKEVVWDWGYNGYNLPSSPTHFANVLAKVFRINLRREYKKGVEDAKDGKVASVRGDELYFLATDGKWYLEYQHYPFSDDDDDEYAEPETDYYGPFDDFDAARKYQRRNLANTGGFSKDTRGTMKPPRRPLAPRGRWAAYSGNPDGKPIYPVEVDHGDSQALSGGHDIMKRLQDRYRIEQGHEPREQNPRLAADTPEMQLHGRRVKVNDAFLDQIKKAFPQHTRRSGNGGWALIHPDADKPLAPSQEVTDFEFYFFPSRADGPGWWSVSYQPGYLILLQKAGDKMRAKTTRMASRGQPLDRATRNKANNALIRAKLDGGGRFRKPDQAYSKALDVLSGFGIELGEVVSSHQFQARPSGTLRVDLAFTNQEDSFSPVEISNSILYLQYTELRDGVFEAVAYLS